MMIVVNESAAASYLYLMGLTIDEELPLTQHLSLLPATCKASLNINFIRTPPIFIRTCTDEYGNPIP